MEDKEQQPADSPNNPLRAGAAVFVATGAWVGLIPFAPGTFGSLWGLLLAWGISRIPLMSVQVAVIAAVCAVGIPICTAAARRLGKKDPGSVVFDEIASMPIVFLLVPVDQVSSPAVLAAGFVLHRIFDISKPPPIRQLERLPEGLGVMADDWLAAAYACLALHLLLWLIPFG